MTDPDDPVTTGRMRTLRIIVFAQIIGLVIFAVVAVLIVQRHAPANATGGILSLIGAAMLAGLGTASVAFPHFARMQSVRRIARGEWQPPQGQDASAYASDGAKLFAVYLSTLIMGLALAESAGIFCCVAYLMEGQPYVLALIGAALVLLVARFPMEGRVRAWMDRQRDWLARQREQTDVI